MYSRLLTPPERSFFLFGPRGTGKSSWVRATYPGAPYFDLLGSDALFELSASPQRLEARLPPGHRGWVVIDEVQKLPEILDEVHRLIEGRRLRFVLTGSSARRLRGKGVNLLAGRAVTRAMHPLTAGELGGDFDLTWSLLVGNLPSVQITRDRRAAQDFLSSYVRTYLREEVQQEGLTRNLGAFSRFLEAASFSQGTPLNTSAVARDSHVERKVVEHYFTILEDLLLASRVPVFTRRARRATVAHPKLYFFDVGVWRTLRPRGPLDSADEIEGPALETLLHQELRAINDYYDLGYTIHYWRTRMGAEVDFVLYGERGLLAFEVKRAARVKGEDFATLRLFLEEYPMASARLVYGGARSFREGPIEVLPAREAFIRLPEIMGA
jgi:predicted AAA+ superfamily ATPase